MSGYVEYRHYSPLHDSMMARLSMWDARGREFFAMIPTDPARVYRETKKRALDAIGWAIGSGMEPGEVRGF